MDRDIKSFFGELSQSDLFQKVGEICTLVNFVSDENELLEKSLEKILKLFDANRGSIFIMKDGSKDLVLRAAFGMRREDQDFIVKKLGQGIVGKVAESMLPILVDDIEEDDRFGNFKARGSYSTPSFICVPLLIKDSLLGVINISDKKTGSLFIKEEMQLLDFLSSQIALNYRRTQIYKDFNNVLKETQDLKSKLGESSQETKYLKKQIDIQEKLATIGKLAGGIAHEFNNPLDGVIRYTNLCLDHIKDDDVVRGYLLEIKHGLNRMTNIVRNLLVCSRNHVSNNEKISFSGVLERSLGSIKSEIAVKNINVNKELTGDLPKINDLGLERVLTNLFRNAIDAMDDNGSLTVKASVTDDNLSIIVSDTGCGVVEPEKIEQIFEPFYTTKDIDRGCGLGLTIVAEIIKSYGGNISAESEPNVGTTFTINLPLKEKET